MATNTDTATAQAADQHEHARGWCDEGHYHDGEGFFVDDPFAIHVAEKAGVEPTTAAWVLLQAEAMKHDIDPGPRWASEDVAERVRQAAGDDWPGMP